MRLNSGWTLPSGLIWLVALGGGLIGPAASPAAAGGLRQPSSPAELGVVLVSNQDRLMVARVSGSLATFGLRAGDEIVAVNGRRVATEKAFVSRWLAGGTGAAAANIVVNRKGDSLKLSAQSVVAARNATASSRTQASAPTAQTRGGGIINPANMVVTSDGRVMHKDVAARLGLEGRPLGGSPAPHGSN